MPFGTKFIFAPGKFLKQFLKYIAYSALCPSILRRVDAAQPLAYYIFLQLTILFCNIYTNLQDQQYTHDLYYYNGSHFAILKSNRSVIFVRLREVSI